MSPTLSRETEREPRPKLGAVDFAIAAVCALALGFVVGAGVMGILEMVRG